MNLLISAMMMWSAEGQDKGLLIRVEPLFQQERHYGERFWMKIIFKNVSEDTLVLRHCRHTYDVGGFLALRLMRIVIRNEDGDNVTFLGIWPHIPQFNRFGEAEPPKGWTRERFMAGTDYTSFLPGDSLIKLLNLYDYTGFRHKPGTYIFDELVMDYSKHLGDWTGMWNGRIEIKNIGYRYVIEDKPVKATFTTPLRLKVGLYPTVSFAEVQGDLIKILKKDPNSFEVYPGMEAVAKAYIWENFRREMSEKRIGRLELMSDSLWDIKEAVARADAIEFLIQDLKAKGYDSEFFRADYWLWLYHYRRTHIGKLGGEK